jgi:ribosomal protein S18 acetylase RimI-like enzyme
VRVISLGFRTDLVIRGLEGSEITSRAGYLAIRSPENPAFRWGNFLLLREPTSAGSGDHWMSVFRAEFPAADYVALGIDATDWAGQLSGFDCQVDSVLTAADVLMPQRPNRDAEYRPLSTDADWLQATDLAVTCYPHDQDFTRRRVAARRRLAEAGHGAWFGAFRDDTLLAHLGIFRTEPGVARFQDVETHPDSRRQGLAGTLIYHAASHAVRTLDARSLVIVADPGEDAIRLYRSLGFAEREQQVSLERLPAAGLPSPTNLG